MAFSRYFDSALQSWWKRPDRKPLILRGARQTGKSTAVRELGKKARQFIELNFERHRDLQIVRSCNSPEQLLQRLKEVFNFADFPSGTLLFLDEVQEHPDAINWLRFFYEDFPQIAVVAAGSLMEVRLRDSALPFPVGRVEFLRIEPLTFLDFLDATSNNQLASSLRNEFSNPDGIPEGLHQLAMDKFRSFLLVGGMPEAVAKWDASADWNEVGVVHESLQQA
ncbi:MAG: AAA family ATPase, partial [Planctomycetes bacterium]|nr:AAA family ATPase [Planctomycetota bacterium]